MNLENWRPIFLVNPVFELASKFIANRIKKVLPRYSTAINLVLSRVDSLERWLAQSSTLSITLNRLRYLVFYYLESLKKHFILLNWIFCINHWRFLILVQP